MSKNSWNHANNTPWNRRKASPKAKVGKAVDDVTESSKRIISNAGVAIVGNLLDKVDMASFNTLESETSHPTNEVPLSDVVISEIATMCCGDPSYEGTREFYEDADFYPGALHIPRILSPERTRQRIEIAAETPEAYAECHKTVNAINLQLLKGEELTQVCGYLPVDIDVSPFDESKSNKENISMTYKKCIGYAPNFLYVGKEGFMLATEFRPGSQHCQKGTPEFLQDSITAVRKIFPYGRVLFRMDSGNDSMDNYGVLLQNGMFFICKRNLRKESIYGWLEHAKRYTLPENIHEPREGKKVYIGSTWLDRKYKDASGNIQNVTLRAVYEIIERTMDHDGQLLMPSDVEVNMFMTNTDLSDKQVIEMYHDHGTCEQYHSELKSDMDFEKVPSGKYLANAFLNDIAMLAFNVLRCVGMRLFDLHKIPKRGAAFRRRITTVVRYMMHIPAMVIDKAHRRSLDLGCSNHWAEAFIYVFNFYKDFVPQS